MRARFLAVAVALLVSWTMTSGQTSLGSIAGVVVDAQTGTPVRFAALDTAQAGRGFSINSDADGQFRLDQLPAGNYQVAASAPGYLRMMYGASKSRPNGVGKSIAVASGEHVKGIRIALVRGAVVAGRITSADGSPVSNVEVRLLTWGYSSEGERTLVLIYGNSRTGTDEDGAYRVFNVPPGTYFVATSGEPPLPIDGAIQRGRRVEEHVAVTTHADVVAVLAGATPQPPKYVERVREAPTFYPGVSRASDAQVITLNAGEERTGIDFPIQKIRAATIRGRVIAGDGQQPSDAFMRVFDIGGGLPGDFGVGGLARIDTDGTFTVNNVLPGDYTIDVGTRSASASSTVTIAGQDVDGVTLVLHPAVTVEGRVEFSSGPPSAEVLAAVQIEFRRLLGKSGSTSGPPASVEADGRFHMKDVLTGRYVVDMTTPRPAARALTQNLWIKSAMIGGRDAVVEPVEIGADVSGAVITIASGFAELTVEIPARQDGAGDETVIVFPDNPAEWGPRSRRIRTGNSGDGVVTLTLLPGAYRVALARDIEPGQWRDPEYLRSLAPTADTVTLTAGDRVRRALPAR